MAILNHHPRRAALAALVALAAGWTVGIQPACAHESPVSEHQVKAAFLVNFSKYVEWPVDAFADTNSPIVMVVVGETQVVHELERIIPGRTVNGRNLLLKPMPSGSEPGRCHILYVSAQEQQRAPGRLTTSPNDATLTVGESEHFLAQGGTINMVRRDQNIALEVNLSAANLARIKISAKLLAVATVVRDP